MKKIISYLIHNPVAVHITLLAFLIFGLFGVNQLKSSFFPLIPSKLIDIRITYPGASPQEIEEGIVLKIEDNLKGLSSISRVTSISSENTAVVTVEIQKDEDINNVLQEVKNAVDKTPSFPTGMEPIVISKQEFFRQTLSFSINGENVSLMTLKQIARDIENDLRQISGISQIEINGYPEEEIEIAVIESKLRAYNLTFKEVATAVSQANLLATGGTIKTDLEDFLIRAKHRFYEGIALNNIVVKTSRDGKVVYLKDVANVQNRFSETPNASFLNGKPSVTMRISNTINEDLVSSAAKVKEYIKKYNDSHSIVKLNILSDRSVPLNQRTQLLLNNALLGAILVLTFLSLFLNPRLAFWVAFSLPFSFLGMFMFIANLGITINVLSLFGMIIVIGILVDDGIVVSENIYQYSERGYSAIQACISGTLEVVPAVLSAILTTIFAFAIFFFLDSRIGEFFKEISTIVILTLSISLLEAFFILPSHMSHSKALAAKNDATSKPSKDKKLSEKFFFLLSTFNKYGEKIIVFLRDKFYSPVLKFSLDNKLLTLSIFFLIFMLTIGSIGGRIIRTTFFPSITSDRISVELSMPKGTAIDITDSLIQTIETVAWEINDDYTAKQTGNKQIVENIERRLGPGSDKAKLIINLLSGENRDFSANEITESLREQVGPVHGVESLIFGSGSNFGGSPVSLSLLSNNIEELKAAKKELRNILQSNSLLKDVNDNDPEGIKELRVSLKESAYLLGLDLRNVINQVRSGFYGVRSQRLQKGQDEIQVWVRYDKSNRNSLSDLEEMRIITPSGERVPFSEIANYSIIRGEVSINHLDGVREIRINADTKNPKVSASDIMQDLKSNIVPKLQSKYPTIRASYEGQNREANKLQASAGKVVPVILFLIYVVIALTFKSYIQPIILFMIVPFSLVGIAWGHWIQGFAINILSWLGIIALVGIMVNDGLVLISKFNKLRSERKIYKVALFEAGISRFRAIFLTSLTTVAGLAPLLLEKSRQAQFLKPMAISISYGIIMSTVLTLLMLPVLLSITNDIRVLAKRVVKLVKK